MSKRLPTEKKKDIGDATAEQMRSNQRWQMRRFNRFFSFCRKYPRVSPKNTLCADLKNGTTEYANQAEERKIRQFGERG